MTHGIVTSSILTDDVIKNSAVTHGIVMASPRAVAARSQTLTGLVSQQKADGGQAGEVADRVDELVAVLGGDLRQLPLVHSVTHTHREHQDALLPDLVSLLDTRTDR